MNSGEPKIPEETMAAALKLHADILGTQGCCDGVPEAVAFAWSEGHGAGRKSVAGPSARVAEESLMTVFRLIERADQEGLDVISIQGLKHLVGTRDEFYQNAEEGRRIEVVLKRWYNLDSAVGL